MDTPGPVPTLREVPTPHEDPERQPDGVPHEVVGQTAFFAVLLAMLAAAFLLVGGWFGVLLAAVLLLVGAPVVISRLSKKSAVERVAHGPHG